MAGLVGPGATLRAMTFTLPAALSPARAEDDDAVGGEELLRRYLTDRLATKKSDPGRAEAPYWSGARFENYGDNPPDVITGDDVVAVSLLGVNVPAHAALAITERQSVDVTKLLNAIDDDVDLDSDGADKLIRKDGPAWELWRMLRSHDDVGPTIASKIMARKRPRLIPVQDSVVRSAVGWHAKADFWSGMRDLLRSNDGELVRRLKNIQEAVPESVHLSRLRVFDIVVWMSAHPLARDD